MKINTNLWGRGSGCGVARPVAVGEIDVDDTSQTASQKTRTLSAFVSPAPAPSRVFVQVSRLSRESPLLSQRTSTSLIMMPPPFCCPCGSGRSSRRALTGWSRICVCFFLSVAMYGSDKKPFLTHHERAARTKCLNTHEH